MAQQQKKVRKQIQQTNAILSEGLNLRNQCLVTKVNEQQTLQPILFFNS